MLGTILIVILVLALVGALPRWSHSREWATLLQAASGWYFSSWSFFCFSGASDPCLRPLASAGQGTMRFTTSDVFLRRNRFCIDVEATPRTLVHQRLNDAPRISGYQDFGLDPAAPRTFPRRRMT